MGDVLGAIVYANLVEYAWHRWVLHGATTGRLGSMRREHARHHAQEFAAPPLASSRLPLLGVWAAHTAVAVGVFGRRRGLKLAAAWAGYMAVAEIGHRWAHAKRTLAHEAHHNQPTRRFNILAPLGDWLFGTW